MWVIFALLSALTNALRTIVIKKSEQIEPEVVIFTTRLTGLLALTPLLLINRIHIENSHTFFIFLTITVFITMAASILRIHIIQKEALNTSIPILGFIPIFMIPFNILFLREFPALIAFSGVFSICLGAYFIHFHSTKSYLQPFINFIRCRGSKWMLGIAVGYGLTTVCDKVIIKASNVFTYTYIWMLASTIVTGYIFFRHPAKKVLNALRNRGNILQAFLWLITFVTQMLSLNYALHIESSASYVKAITMFHILFTTIMARYCFHEKGYKEGLIGSSMIVIGAIIIVFSV